MHSGDVTHGDGLPQHLIDISQSTQSRRVFSPGALAEKAKDTEECWR